MTEQEVFEKLIPLVREVTGARFEQIGMDSGLMEDLGAESVDLLDFTFLIEEAFGITIEADEFEQQARRRMGDVPYEKDGYLTPEALDQLRNALPEVPAECFKEGLKAIEVPGILTVGVFVHLIERKLGEEQPEADNG
ncbi:MAG: hypothetical protein IH624_05150 [Phycisphaerae bacterium]|nr:hypothetical protein [Phycisphaerae bacterium]